MEIVIHCNIKVSCKFLEAVFLLKNARFNSYLHQNAVK